MITQCPSCETRFVVREEQLKVANGNVRCGSCMKVFFAADHQVGDSNASSDTAESAPKFSSAVYAQAGQQDEHKETQAEKNIDAILGLDEGADDTQSTEKPEHDGADATHEWLNKLLPDQQTQQRSQPLASEPSEQQAPQSGLQASDDIDWQGEAVSEIGAAPEPEPEPESEPEETDQTVIASVSNDAVERIYEDGRIEPSLDTGERFNPLHRIDSQPVELNIEKVNAGDWLKKVAGALLCAALLAVFLAQWMLNNPDDFRQHSQFGGAYEWVCEISGCQNRSTDALTAAIYQAQSTLVYSHPDQENALIVESLILNQSTGSQPFPDIELEFTDHQGVVKASRRFTPAEYLQGELIGATQMPAATPIQIALEIADPGSDAVNYTLRLISAL